MNTWIQAQLHRFLADSSHAADGASTTARQDLLWGVHSPGLSRPGLGKGLAQPRQGLSCVSLDGGGHLLKQHGSADRDFARFPDLVVRNPLVA